MSGQYLSHNLEVHKWGQPKFWLGNPYLYIAIAYEI